MCYLSCCYFKPQNENHLESQREQKVLAGPLSVSSPNKPACLIGCESVYACIQSGSKGSTYAWEKYQEEGSRSWPSYFEGRYKLQGDIASIKAVSAMLCREADIKFRLQNDRCSSLLCDRTTGQGGETEKQPCMHTHDICKDRTR